MQTELALTILEKAGKNIPFPKAQIEYQCSKEYWAGWILAYYQWTTGKSFRNIFETVSITDVLRMYPTLHEASEDKFVDTVNSMTEHRKFISNLQKQRKNYGYSQKEPAKRSGVNLRTPQQYELGSKDLSKASVSTVLSLSTALGCKVEDIL